MDKNSILGSYAAWLKNQGIKSVNIYTSGIRKVNDDYFFPVRHKSMFDELPEAIRRMEAVDWLTSLESLINLDYEKIMVRRATDDFGSGEGPIV